MEEPRRLGDYELLTELATGGVATVFVARHVGDAGFERLVAIKRVHRHLLREPEVFASLADEARLSALVRHPNVVATHEVLDQRGELLLVQEYVEGVSLALLHKRAVALGAPLPVAAISRIAVDFLRGLHAAHEALDLRGAPLELVHRDVSPQNILVGADGIARLIDFGIARAAGRIAETRGGILKGKLVYMAPEQVGERDVDRRADVFAAGVVIFELCTGERPFEGRGEAETMAHILAADPDLSKIAAHAHELSSVLERALARAPAARWETAETLAEAIAVAVRPATDGAMRALVKELVGDTIDERRATIREELGRADGEALATEETAGLDAAPKVPSPDPRGRSPIAWVVLGLAVASLIVGLLLGGSATSASGPSLGAAASPSSHPSSHRPTEALPAAPLASEPPAEIAPVSSLPSGAPSSLPSGAPLPPPSTRRPAASRASSSPSVRPDLHGNPYGP